LSNIEQQGKVAMKHGERRTTGGSESGCVPNNDQGKRFSMTDMTVVQDKMKAIAAAHADYAKSSFEANKDYLTKIAAIKSPDQAIQITTDHMKSAYETFVADSTKIGGMYKDFFKSAFEPMTVGRPTLAI
jgi:hypothetical protein